MSKIQLIVKNYATYLMICGKKPQPIAVASSTVIFSSDQQGARYLLSIKIVEFKSKCPNKALEVAAPSPKADMETHTVDDKLSDLMTSVSLHALKLNIKGCTLSGAAAIISIVMTWILG